MYETMGVLDGRVSVVVGATSAIGAEIARMFAGERRKSVIAGRRETLAARLDLDQRPRRDGSVATQ